MKAHRLIVASLLALVLWGVSPVLGQDRPTRVAVASPARIFNQMQETRDLQQKMESDRRTLEQSTRERQERIRALQEARNQLKSDSPQYQERNRELLEAAVEFKAWSELQQADLQRQYKTQMRNLFNKIESVTAEIARERGFDVVIADHRPEIPTEVIDSPQFTMEQLRAAINERNLLFVSESADITNDVLARLDQKYRGN